MTRLETAPRVDPLIERTRTDVRRYVLLLAQLSLLLVVFRAFRVEQFGPVESGFFLTCCIAFAGFAVQYWLPLRVKETFSIGVSLLALVLLLDVRIVAALLGAGAAFYFVLNSRLPYWRRVGLLLALCAAAMLVRRFSPQIDASLGADYIPETLWPVFGSIFMFRMIIYVHDLRHMEHPPSLREYLAYFFLLPNYYFHLFPVIDYQVMRKSYYRRDIHEVAQQGISWICRGTVQLLLYRIVSYFNDLQSVEHVNSPGSLFLFMVLTYLLYLRVSGHFHIIVGLLHLFGYDLPETNRKYLLASSLTDFWRRINIYWKDFMVKIVYFPVYFRLRKRSELGAKLLATVGVFFVTWALHSYQAFWLNGQLRLGLNDSIFWAVLGLLVTANVWIEHHRRKQPASGWAPRLATAVSTFGTFIFITVLWSLWSSPTLGSWAALLDRGF